ncbi:MAG TPA: gluconate 2-dehydrogenase subunit 3 family protein [Bryobacteraceae bacterium]|nr:gluconate 2-dehydrogenase subunit 3 family protein [Bryobacteraceae bacterium]
MKRREFLTVPVKGLGGVLIYSLAGEAIRLQAQDGVVRVPLRFFTEAEARTVQTACARIFPSDESGPGATEANVIVYIDHQLAGPLGSDKNRYTKGPWVDSMPEHGYQGKETPQEIYRAGIARLGADFATLSPPAQDERLRAIEKTMFFTLLRTHTIEGMFSDPLHGGNAGLIGWQLIGYPGPLMSYRDEIDKYHGMPFEAKPKSLEQVVGRKVQGLEDEKI